MKNIPVYGITEFSEGEEKSYFYANDLKTHLESHKFVNDPHKHSTYITLLFTRGSGQHFIDFDSYPVKAGSVFLLKPGQVHSWKLSSDVKGYVFIHTAEFYNGIFLNRKIEDFPFFYLQQNSSVIYLDEKNRKRVENLFTFLYNEDKGNSEFRLAKLEALSHLIYIELSELYRVNSKLKSAKLPNYLKVQKLQKLVDDHFVKIKSPSEYADMMNMSIRHLNRICKETINKSIGDLIVDRIILEAKRILIHSDVAITSAANQLGYEDHSYFIRLFRKKTGQTPKEFQTNL